MPDRPTAPPPDPVSDRTVVGKAVAILMTYLYGSSHTFSEIVSATGMPVSTVHRLVLELTACGMLDRTESGRYRIAAPLRRIATAPGSAVNLESRAALALRDLSVALDTEVRFGVLRDHRVAYIEQGRGRRPVTTFGAGATASVHASAMGLVLLAFSPTAVVDAALLHALTAPGAEALPSRERVVEVLRRARLRHLAVLWNEPEPDRSAIAVPVFRAGGLIAAALEARVHNPSRQLAVLQSALVVAGRSLTRQLSSTGRDLRPVSVRQRNEA